MDFTSLTGQLCQTESSVSGFQSKVRSRSPGKICHREPSSSSTRWLSEWDRILVARSFRVAGLGMRRPIGYFCPDGACASSCWGRACWLRDGRPHIPPQRRACRGQPCGRRRTDDGALDASLGLRRREGGECQQAKRLRRVPIHKHLIDQGFLQYVEQRRKIGKPLFYEPAARAAERAPILCSRKSPSGWASGYTNP